MPESMSDPLIAQARALMGVGRHAEAAAALARAHAQAPDDLEAGYLLAVCWLELDRDAEALALCRRLLPHHADHPLLQFILGRALLANGEPKAALEAADRAAALDPLDADHHALRGCALLELSRAEDALACAERALALDADSMFAAKVHALALQALGRFDEAGRAATEQLRRDPHDAVTWRLLGYGHLRAGKPRDALDAFGEALRIDPGDAPSRVGLAEALKARSLPYRWYVQLSDWIERGGTKRSLIVIGVIYVLPRLLRPLARADERWLWLVVPVSIACALAVLASWMISPLHDLLLIGNPKVRHVLTRNGWIEALYLGAALVAALIGVVLIALASSGAEISAAMPLVLSPFLIVAIHTGLAAPRGWRRKVAVPLSVLAVLGYTGGTALALVYRDRAFEENPGLVAWGLSIGLIGLMSWLALIVLAPRR
ncbi:MAG: tetratricopeptide repeat protein [Planctomycetota bacterium]|nr:MAG: tetratricopeptide repeat protein [Planctomycetota bacterium]